jgi:hypothetical protein
MDGVQQLLKQQRDLSDVQEIKNPVQDPDHLI